MQKHTQNMLFGMLTLIAVLAILPMVSASVAWVVPAAGSNLSSSVLVNCSYANVTDVTTPLTANTTFWYNGSGTWVAMSKSGFTVSANAVWATVDLTGLTDSTAGSFNCTLGNVTKVLGGTTLKVTVDNTAPVVSITRDNPSISSGRLETITWASSDATSGLTSTAVSITSPDADRCPTLSYTDTSSTVELSEEQVQCKGEYTATITSTDYAGKSATASETFEVTIPDGNFIGEKSLQSISDNAAPTQDNTGMIIVIALVALAVYFIVKKK